MPSRRFCRRALPVLGVVLAIPLVAILLIFVLANGLTFSSLALASLPILVALLCFLLPTQPSRRRVLGAIVISLSLFDIGYVLLRLRSREPREAVVRYCEGSNCRASPPFISRIPDEGETAMSGLLLSSVLGLIHGEERDSLERLLGREYELLSTSPRFDGLPNATLISGGGGHRPSLTWVPPGRTDGPCLVFLHGFGGQLTIYLQSLMSSGLAEESAIVAPFLDTRARWWHDTGEAIVSELIESNLPNAVDRDRVYLVGLSNGAIGAARLAQNARLSHRIAGVILISGSAQPLGPDLDGLDILVITGADDPRFPLAGVESDVAALSSQGAQVELEILEGDHFILLSHKREVAQRIGRWIGGR